MSVRLSRLRLRPGRKSALATAAVLRVQRLHHITGPQTRSAMRWRMYNVKTKVWTRRCYDRL